MGIFRIATLFVSFLACVPSLFSQQLPNFYTTTDDTYLSQNNPDTNYGSLPYMKLKKVRGEDRGLVKFNLDGAQILYPVINNPIMPDFLADPNHWYNIESASLNMSLVNISGCSQGCDLYLYSSLGNINENLATWNCPTGETPCSVQWDGGSFVGADLIDILKVYDGQVGDLMFDITEAVIGIRRPYMNVTFIVQLEHSGGEVFLGTKEGGEGANISVVNPAQSIAPLCPVYFAMIDGSAGLINMTYSICEPDVEIPGQLPVWLSPGQPQTAYIYMNTMKVLANLLNRPIYYNDWVGSGLSYAHILTNTLFNYSILAQKEYLSNLIDYLNITQNGTVKFHHFSYEEGSVSGLSYDAQYPQNIASSASSYISYLNSCPEPFINTNVGIGIPPSYGPGVGLCGNESLVPRQAFGGPLNSEWVLWNTCVYPSYQCTCEVFCAPFLNPGDMYLYFSVCAPPPLEVLQLNSPYPNCTQDPTCNQSALLHFPQHVPIVDPSVPNCPQESIDGYYIINDYVRSNETIPKLIFLTDNAVFLPMYTPQYTYILENYVNTAVSFTGTCGSHMMMYDHFYNFAQHYAEFILDVEAGRPIAGKTYN